MIVYVLKLQQGKYYVGKTHRTIIERYEEHARGLGSNWTRLYPPIPWPTGVLAVITTADNHRETSETLRYMQIHGIENVRGGPYSQVTLTPATESAIAAQLRHDNDECLRCGRRGHFQATCNATTTVRGEVLVDDSDDENGIVARNDSCLRCGRRGHGTSSCYASTTENGVAIVNDYCRDTRSNNFSTDDGSRRNSDRCLRCGRSGHDISSCYASTTVDGTILNDDNRRDTRSNIVSSRRTSNRCLRCGRTGHDISNCYARSAVHGISLSYDDDDDDDESDSDDYDEY